jgi:hypothetical protein
MGKNTCKKKKKKKKKGPHRRRPGKPTDMPAANVTMEEVLMLYLDEALPPSAPSSDQDDDDTDGYPECQCRRRPADELPAWPTEPAEPIEPAAAEPAVATVRREWLDFRGYVHGETMRKFGTKQLTHRANITCFRCGEQGHYRIECMSWRTKMCLHHDRPTGCREGENCSYAHSDGDLRSPWHAKCVRVIKRHGQIFTLGCHSNTHTFKACPHMSCTVCGSNRHWTCESMGL